MMTDEDLNYVPILNHGGHVINVDDVNSVTFLNHCGPVINED